MRFSRLGRLLAALFTATLLLLAACGDDDEGAATGGVTDDTDEDVTDEETTDDEPEEDDGDDESTTTTAGDTTTTTEAEPEVASGGDCIIGTWHADNEAWGESFQSMVPADTPMQLDSVTGTVRLEFGADGTVVTTYEDWTINADVTQPAGSVTITRAGVDTSTYSAGDDGSFSLTEVESGSTVSTEMTMGGQTMSMPEAEGMQTDLIGGAGTYQCDGDRMSIDVEGATVWMDRVA